MTAAYPTTHLHREHSPFSIAQISDLHLTGKIGQAPSYKKFLAVLAMATKDRPDLILLTGDLCNDGNLDAYDWLFDTLNQTTIPFLCLAGNHDVTHEIGIRLPHHQRLHLPIWPDARLLNQHQVHIQVDQQNWQLLLLNSAICGETYGSLSQQSLAWLDASLTNTTCPTLIALHHHPLAMDSAWMDEYILKNADAFWQIIAKHQHTKAILCGHVHQAHDLTTAHHDCRLLTCPSTDRQFLPKQADFAIDPIAAGYRLIQLDNKGQLVSYIKRLHNTPA